MSIVKKQEYHLQAKTLEAAVANLNEQVSLVFDGRAGSPVSASSEFYVNRPDNPMNELKTFLITSPGYDKILFSGHMGCGKSTELNRFSNLPEIKEKFFVVKYSISEILNIIDIDYIDFLLSFAAYLYIKASDAGISFTEPVLKTVEKWVNYFKSGMEGENWEEENAAPSIARRIYNFFSRVSMILLRELALRDKVRETIQRNIASLVEVINALVTHITSQLEDKELLVIIDDLEKIPHIGKAEELFIKAGTYMTVPRCKIIYTAPIALYYSIKFQQMVSVFGNSYFLPNIKVRERHGTGAVDPSGCMKEFLKKRIDVDRISKEAVDLMIENSAGVARELVRIVKNSCVKAISRGHDTIETDMVRAVIADLRNEFQRGLEKRHLDVLQAIMDNRQPEDQESLMELFHSKVVLEYTNGERWTAVNPVVAPLLVNISQDHAKKTAI
ncbi:MAG: hypothetical protein NT166_13990 [Candidatus Aminicenantes bacterium]|nr:hypothetical protein [Candidatus Aminicenantes bacterium]